MTLTPPPSSSSRFDHWLFHEFATPTKNLATFRILFASVLLLLQFPRWLWIPAFSDPFFNPPLSLAYLLPSLPPAPFFYALNFLGITATLFLLLGKFTKPASLTLALTLFLGNSFDYSFGKINHDILVLLIPLLLAFSPWGHALSLDSLRQPPHPPTRSSNSLPPSSTSSCLLALLAALLASAMMFAALEKIRGGWLSPHRHATWFYLLLNYHQFGLQNPLNTFVLHHNTTPLTHHLWKTLDYATVLLEASFLLAVIRLRSFRTVLAFACFFHLSIALLLEISFWYSLAAYAAFVDWSFLYNSAPFQKIQTFLAPLLSRLNPLHILLLSTTLFLLYSSGINLLALGQHFTQEPSLLPSLTLWLLATTLATIYLLKQLRRVR